MQNTNREKLFLISPMLHQGGFERVCVTTARLLEPYYEVYVVIFDDKDIAYDIEGLRILNLELGVKKGKLNKALNVLRRARALKRLKGKYKPVAAYSFGPSANYANCLSKTRETKVLTGLRSFMDVENERETGFFLKHADRIISCSEEINEVLKSKFGYEHAITLYNPFDVKDINEKAAEPDIDICIDEKTIKFVSTGRICAEKGFWHMIKAFAAVHNRYPDTELIILGEGDFTLYYELAEKLGCRDAVYHAGMQKNPYKYVSKCNIYLLTSGYEGFPNAMVEAMALSLPVISTDCRTGPKEILLSDEEKKRIRGRIDAIYEAEYGMMIKALSKEENFDISDIEEEQLLISAMQTLTEDEAKRSHYSRMSLMRAGDFSAEKYTERLKDIIGSLC